MGESADMMRGGGSAGLNIQQLCPDLLTLGVHALNVPRELDRKPLLKNKGRKDICVAAYKCVWFHLLAFICVCVSAKAGAVEFPSPLVV